MRRRFSTSAELEAYLKQVHHKVGIASAVVGAVATLAFGLLFHPDPNTPYWLPVVAVCLGSAGAWCIGGFLSSMWEMATYSELY